MKKWLVGLLLFGSSLAYAGEYHLEVINQPIVDIGAGAHIKGPLVVKDSITGEVVFSVRSESALDVGYGSTGVQLFSHR